MSSPLSQFLSLPDPADPARPRALHYRLWGDPAAPETLVCLHGLTRSGRDFNALAARLAPERRILCPDMAGRGASDALLRATDYHYGTYVADIMRLLSHLGIARTQWLGTSMGGILGMMLAAATPALISRLALNDIGSHVEGAGLARILTYAGHDPLFPDEASAREGLKPALASFGLASDAEWQAMFEISLRKTPEGYRFAYDPRIIEPLRQTPPTDVDLSVLWAQITCPVFIIRGEHSDILTRATAQAMLKRPYPTELLEIPATGHAPALLASDQIDVVAHWLSSPQSPKASNISSSSPA